MMMILINGILLEFVIGIERLTEIGVISLFIIVICFEIVIEIEIEIEIHLKLKLKLKLNLIY